MVTAPDYRLCCADFPLWHNAQLRVIFVLRQKHALLGLDFRAQLLLVGEVELVLAHEELLAVVHHGVSGNVLVSLSAQNDAQGGAVALVAHEIVVHAHIHVHLTHVLVRDPARLEVYEHEAAKDVVVEDEVDEEVVPFGAQVLLPGNKGVALAQLEEELLQRQ